MRKRGNQFKGWRGEKGREKGDAEEIKILCQFPIKCCKIISEFKYSLLISEKWITRARQN